MRITNNNAWLVLAIAIAVGGSLLSWQLWPELQDDTEPLTNTIRNIALVLGGTIAVILAIWRSKVAEQQVRVSQEQAQTARISFFNDRYERGAAALGSDEITVRLGGIYSLERLIEENPREYETQALDLLCAFVRTRTRWARRLPKPSSSRPASLPWEPMTDEDVQAAMNTIGRHPDGGTDRKRHFVYRLDLRNANLEGADLEGLDLSRIDFTNATLSYARCRRAVFIQSSLEDALLYGTRLSEADLTRAQLRKASLVRCQAVRTLFREVRFIHTDLSGAVLRDSNFEGSTFTRSHLDGANFQRSNLSDVRVWGTDLTHADVTDADLSGARLGSISRDESLHPVRPTLLPVKLSQNQLDSVHAVNERPPQILFGVVDPQTGEQPQWKGGRPRDERSD